MENRGILIGVVVILIIAGFGAFAFWNTGNNTELNNENSNTETETSNISETEEDILVVAQNLTIPWEIAFLPEGGILVTERPGRLVIVGDNPQSFNIPGVHHEGEGGLLGLALHPNFETNRLIYLYHTTIAGGSITNQVVRYTLDENHNLSNREIILSGIPGARTHNGGRIAFGPDNLLYITTGDAQITELSQNRNSLA
jgi:aldose sugar dehydrogenase